MIFPRISQTEIAQHLVSKATGPDQVFSPVSLLMKCTRKTILKPLEKKKMLKILEKTLNILIKRDVFL